ncbi:uncharacterized protein LACBIDRAFT_318175 [Laccaria bicolor S238N-H82]|uniref:pyranose dehydrogenase (acceptor) n=1 Tax=Laccaria bicolor (strain S238N-H82 / ATCC MYA-4686) TaxID=486041 RepID=B0D657_LACBS|nr:uncharacterized protein LACBIDRAFT_318175 [Laccaria bicolor S238N-H82]EDR09885.1 predicted protein [Laccaria bicolor S238N-H82]|eukprot:XP_001879270.1 predicted protein [Laccaria bicolor S238N-H82]
MVVPPVAVLLVSCICFPSSLAALYTEPRQLPRHTYDYVIVGAGNAGNVIASRLSEDPRTSILVLEAGVRASWRAWFLSWYQHSRPICDQTACPPFGNETEHLLDTPYDWNYTVTPQKGLNGRTFPYNRGKILGGSSSVNYMVHQYGSSEDYDKIAEITGDAGWNWDNVKRNIGKHEKIVPPADGHDTTGQYIPANHGTNGMLSVSLPGSSQLIDSRVIATTRELSEEFPFNEDMGAGISATTYLAAAINRPNVHVLLNAHVTKLLRTGTIQGVPSFRSVEFAGKPGAPSIIVTARREIVLSAGSIGTPQILLLSGIGARDELEALGIPVVVENPSVGKNLSDHVLVPNIFRVKDGESLDALFRDPALFKAALDEWMETKRGVLASSMLNHMGYFRLPSTSSIFSTISDPASGPKASHWELIVTNFYINPKPGHIPPETGSYLGLVSALISPTSRGSVTLASADPFAHPLIDPNYLTTPFDIFAMRETVRAVKRFAAAEAWKDYIIAPFGNFSSDVDADLDAYIRDQASTVYHMVGTASMSPRGAEWGVVDPDLKVKGAEGIRIVDASVLPFPPNAHTQGPV